MWDFQSLPNSLVLFASKLGLDLLHFHTDVGSRRKRAALKGRQWLTELRFGVPALEADA